MDFLHGYGDGSEVIIISNPQPINYNAWVIEKPLNIDYCCWLINKIIKTTEEIIFKNLHEKDSKQNCVFPFFSYCNEC